MQHASVAGHRSASCMSEPPAIAGQQHHPRLTQEDPTRWLCTATTTVEGGGGQGRHGP
jgi:hypothetical protein